MEKLIPKLRFSGFVDYWVKSNLKELGNVVTGSTPQTSNREYYGEDRLFVSPFDIQGQRFVVNTKTKLSEEGFKKCRTIPANSVLVVCIGSTIGKVAQSGCECATNQQINAFISSAGFSDNFIYYVLDKNSDKIKLLAGVQAVPILNKTQFSAFEIFTPTLPEQTKIAEFLTAIDKRIELLTAKKEKLTLYKKGVMQKIFNQEIRFRADDGGEFPEWEEKKLGDVTTISTGGTPSTTIPDYWGGSIKWMNSGDINRKQVDDVSGRITEKGVKNSSTKLIPIHCVLIALAGQGKTRGMCAINNIELCINQSLAAIFPNSLVFVPTFLYYTIEMLYQELRSLSSGNDARGGLNLKILKDLNIMFPFLKEQSKIAGFLGSLDIQIQQIEQQITLNQKYKKGLLQKIFV